MIKFGKRILQDKRMGINMSRPLKLETFMKMAKALSEQSTCIRRNVGCILLDNKLRIIGSGYNGSSHGASHCIDTPCKGAHFLSGKGLDMCEAIHAEQNALMQCKDIDAIHIAVCTTFPCKHCTKMLLNTGCNLIVFNEDYESTATGLQIWVDAKRLQRRIIV